jgi:hypothetical protein
VKVAKQHKRRSKRVAVFKLGDLARVDTVDTSDELVIIIERYEEMDRIELNDVWEERWLMEPEDRSGQWHYYDIMYNSGIVEHAVSEIWLSPQYHTALRTPEDIASE